MYNKDIVCNYILAKLATGGIDVNLSEVYVPGEIINGKDIRIQSQLTPTKLGKAVDFYTAALSKSGAPKHEVEPLGKKLKYILKVYESFTPDPFLVGVESFSNSSIKLSNIARTIFNSTADAMQDYINLMQVDGEVLIARFVLLKFWHSDFADFIDFIRASLNNQITDIADALWSINYALQKCYNFEYKRRINSELYLKMTFSADDWFENEAFMDSVTLTDGNHKLVRNDERLLRFFENASKGIKLPVTLNFNFFDKSDNQIVSFSTASYVTCVRRGRYLIEDYRDLVHKAFALFRSELVKA